MRAQANDGEETKSTAEKITAGMIPESQEEAGISAKGEENRQVETEKEDSAKKSEEVEEVNVAREVPNRPLTAEEAASSVPLAHGLGTAQSGPSHR